MSGAVIPAPDGNALRMTIACTALPTDSDGPLHDVLIHPDWTVTTVHDLETERIARGLGAWSACLHFAESIVPAYRHVLAIMDDPQLLRRDRRGGWHNTTDGQCGLWLHRHMHLREAVRHELSAEHATGLFASDDWQLPGVETVAYTEFHRLTRHARDLWVEAAAQLGADLEPYEYARLWRAGVNPVSAALLAAAFPPWAAAPLTREYVLGAHFVSAERGASGVRP